MVPFSSYARLLACLGAVVGLAVAQTLPIVDLGYELQQATAFNVSNERVYAAQYLQLAGTAPATCLTSLG